MLDSTRRSVLKAAGAAGIAGLVGTGTAAAGAERIKKYRAANRDVAVTAEQSAGNSVHWILPGPRRLDPFVFGTPADGPSSPQRGLDHIRHKIWYFDQHRPAIADLLRSFPVPVGWPEKFRATTEDGTAYTHTTEPLPFSDNAVGSAQNPNLDGSLDLRYVDRQGFEGDGPAGDEIDLDVWFADPEGHRYELDIHHLETHDGAHPHGRGVMTGVYMHGITGIGTPLMPTQFAFGSFWAVGDLLIDGEVTHPTNRDRIIHFMTTQNVRNQDYELAIDSDLPLGAHGNDDPYLGNPTHTHVMLPPVQATEKGPQLTPLKTGFTLPNGAQQPFIHFMFDEDSVAVDRAATPPQRP